MKKLLMRFFVILELCLLLMATAISGQPNEFEIQAPADGKEQVPVWPLFKWSTDGQIPNVTYSLQISKTTGFEEGNYVRYDGLTGDQFRPRVDLVMDSIQYWRVVAFDEFGDSTICNAKDNSIKHFHEFQTITPDIQREVQGGGSLDYDRTLIPQNNPYHLVGGDFLVPEERWFGIRPGVHLLIDGGYNFSVSGQIDWRGSLNNRITIESAGPNPAAGDWRYIVFNDVAPDVSFDLAWDLIDDSAGSVIEYVDFRHAGGNTSLIESPNTAIYVAHCTFTASSNPRAINIGSGSLIHANEIDGFSCVTMAASYGGGIQLVGDGTRLSDNRISNCNVKAQGDNNSNNVSNGYAFGGGLYATGSNIELIGNTVENCYAYGMRWWNYYSYGTQTGNDRSYSYGGGIYVDLDNSVIMGNTLSGCWTEHAFTYNKTPNGSRSHGGGIYIDEGTGNTFASNTLLNNEAKKSNVGSYWVHGYGGGVYVYSSGVELDSAIVSGSKAYYGAGIYCEATDTRIDHSTITNNISDYQGGGIYCGGGVKIFNSTIKYNEAPAISGGGIYGDPDSVYFCNINHNTGMNIVKHVHDVNDTTFATENWWYTREEIEINDSIWDRDDTGENPSTQLGPVISTPIKTDVSPTTRDVFKNAYRISLMNDSTYSSVLSHTITEGDTIYFEIIGTDENPYSRNVCVIDVENFTNPVTDTNVVDSNYILPFYEETSDNSGVWHGAFYLGDETRLPDQIFAENHDTLQVRVRNDPEVKLLFVVGGSTCLVHKINTGDSCLVQINGVSLSGDAISDGDAIGIFDGEICVGAGSYTGTFPLTIAAWQDDPSTDDIDGYTVGHEISYRIARLGTCERVDVCVDANGYVQGDGLFASGSLSAAALDDNCPRDQFVGLRAGWNLMSLNVHPQSSDILDVFADILPDVDIIKQNNGLFCIPGMINDLDPWDAVSAYQVHMRVPRTLYVRGNIVPCDTPIVFQQSEKWQYVGYTPDIAIDATVALAGLGNDLVICKASDGTFYIPSIPINSLGDMEPGKGYKMFVSTATTLSYDCTGGFPKQGPVLKPQKPRHFAVEQQTSDYHATILRISGDLATSDEIGFFTKSGLLVGSCVFSDSDIPVAIWKDNPETEEIDGFVKGDEMILKIWRASSNSEDIIDNSGIIGLDDFGESAYSVLDINLTKAGIVPYKFELSQNYPNPFNPTTTINFSISKAGEYSLVVYNSLGQEVATLINGYISAGPHTVTWDGTNANGEPVASGVYFYRLESEFEKMSLKMILLK